MKQVPWTKIIMEEFIRLSCMTKVEEEVLRTRCNGWTRVEQSQKLGLSLSTIDRAIASLKRKYDQVQPYSVILPPRKHGSEELYMDEN